MTRDERIAKFRIGLHPLFLPYYDALWAIVPIEFAPYFGLRSLQEQSLLYAKGRDESGKIISPGLIITYAKPGQSSHNYGCACDASIFDEAGMVVWLDKNDPKWIQFGDAVSKVGATWGGDFTGNRLDPDHFELPIKCSWADVAKVLNDEGEALALRFIGENKLA